MKRDLQYLNHRLNQAQELAHIGSWELSFATRKAIWSAEACRIYGLDPKDNQHTYEDWESFIHPDDLQMMRDSITASGKDRSTTRIHHRIVLRDGTVKHVYSITEFELDENGWPLGLYGSVQDLTESVTLRNELIRTEHTLTTIIDMVPLCIFARDKMGNYVFANKYYKEHIAGVQDDLTGKNVKDVIPDEQTLQLVLKHDHDVLHSDKDMLVFENTVTLHNNTKTWRMFKMPYRLPDNERGILCVAEDITNDKESEKNLRLLAETLAKRNAELESFSSIVSHDLRGPLASIMGISQLLEQDSISKEELTTAIKGIKQSLQEMDAIVSYLNSATQTGK